MNKGPLLDTWTFSTDVDTQKDVQGVLTYSKKQQCVNIAQDGKVLLDFGDMSSKKVNRLLKKDDGLNLINDLVNAKEDYYYSTSPDFQSRGLKR